LYYGKNILNVIRQEKGYKKGNYIKLVEGVEDNKHLIRLIEKIDAIQNFQDFKKKLFEVLSDEDKVDN